jgi:hypothetical protein
LSFYRRLRTLVKYRKGGKTGPDHTNELGPLK